MDIFVDSSGVYYAPGAGNGTLVLDADGDLWAVMGDLPGGGWQDLSALEVARLVAGMPG